MDRQASAVMGSAPQPCAAAANSPLQTERITSSSRRSAVNTSISAPSSRTIDSVNKPRRYLDFGVPAYWVVDPFEGAIRV
jgi:hypothetical protein